MFFIFLNSFYNRIAKPKSCQGPTLTFYVPVFQNTQPTNLWTPPPQNFGQVISASPEPLPVALETSARQDCFPTESIEQHWKQTVLAYKPVVSATVPVPGQPCHLWGGAGCPAAVSILQVHEGWMCCSDGNHLSGLRCPGWCCWKPELQLQLCQRKRQKQGRVGSAPGQP